MVRKMQFSLTAFVYFDPLQAFLHAQMSIYSRKDYEM